MLVGKGRKITKLEIKKCTFYSPYESSSILKMLCKNLEDPGFFLGGNSSFVLKGKLIVSSRNQDSRTEIEGKKKRAPRVTFGIT